MNKGPTMHFLDNRLAAREALRTKLRMYTDEALQELVFSAHYAMAESLIEESTMSRDPDEVYTDHEYDGETLCRKGRKAVIEWLVTYTMFPLVHKS